MIFLDFWILKQKSAHVLPTLLMQTGEGAKKESVHPPLPQLFQLMGVCTHNLHTSLILAFLGAAPCQHASCGFFFTPYRLLFATPCLPLTGPEHGSALVFLHSFMALTRPLKCYPSAMHSPFQACPSLIWN